MKGKRGQAFLIGALLIISVLAGFIGVSNSLQGESTHNIKEKGKEIDIEKSRVMDYALVNKDQNEELNISALNNFTKQVSGKSGPDSEIYFLSDFGFNAVNSSDCFRWDGGSKNYCGLELDSKNINSSFDFGNYTFKNNKGKDFYFILVKESQGERYIYSNG